MVGVCIISTGDRLEAIGRTRWGSGKNGYAESFHGRLRDELLNAELFADVREAKAMAAAWKNEYNHPRPHSSLAYVPPAVFAATLAMPPVGAACSTTLTRLS